MTARPRAISGHEAQIPDSLVPAVRPVWILFALFLIALEAFIVPHYFRELQVICALPECPTLTLMSREIDVLGRIGLSTDFYAGFLVGIDVMTLVILIPLATLIIWRRPDLQVSLVAAFTLGLMSVNYSRVPVYFPEWGWLALLLDNATALLLVWLFFVFPDGHFVPRWTVAFVLIALTPVVYGFFISPQAYSEPSVNAPLSILWVVSLLVGVGAQIYRYRRVSTPLQRQQSKMVLLAFITMAIVTSIWFSFTEFFPLQTGPARLAFNLSYGVLWLFVMLLPFSFVLSILRYRLWEIDILIRRTLQYSLLTLILAAVYFGGVVLLQNIFGALAEQEDSPLITVLSTLAIAALFNPLRVRIQDFIDKRFYRAKYDSEQTLARFANTARDVVDIESLAAAMLGAVDETMQPERISLWLKQI